MTAQPTPPHNSTPPPSADPFPAPAGVALRDIEGGVCAAVGFRAGGVHAGIRSKRLDLAMILADAPAAAAGVFTQSTMAAAPVRLCRARLSATAGRARGVVINSGNANACTGPQGKRAAREMGQGAAAVLNLVEDEILVCSTGVIGEQLPIDTITAALPDLSRSLGTDKHAEAAEAIMTTDTVRKEVAVEVTCASGTFRVGGMAKGAGMVHPNMATTLAFVTTDAPIAAGTLQAALREATDATFNQVTIDGDTSTNDTILAFALGKDGLDATAFKPGEPGHAAFRYALTHVLMRLGRMVAEDAEGATKLITVDVQQAATLADARLAARSIARSPLVKTAIAGADANWGRVAGAIGAANVKVNDDRFEVWIAGLPMLQPGFRSNVDEAEATRRMKAYDEIVIRVVLGAGEHRALAWGCELTEAYIRINADYRS